jgi:acyl-CoA synthetase (AMP-forming)/AMP-acid ligase II
MNLTLNELIASRATQRGAQVLFEDARSDRVVSYRDLACAVYAMAARLHAAGAQPGDAVLLSISDVLAFAVAHLSVIAAGFCSVPVDPGAPQADLARTIAATTPVLILADHCAGTSSAAPGQVLDLQSLLTNIDSRLMSRPSAAGTVRLSTSGSTGEPKIVELTEAQLLHVARAVAGHNDLTTHDRGYNSLPLFHINAQVVALLATLTAGATLVLDRRFHRTGFWATIQDRRITWINAVPAILAILAAEPVQPRPTALRLVRSASAPLPVAVRQRIETLLQVPLIESYGMTEAASQITATPLRGGAPSGSAGHAAGAQVQIRDGGALARPGQIGAVWIRGDGVIASYVAGRDPDRFDAEGWLRTGDLGSIDAEGFLSLTGRIDDVINRGGELVYPREVEEVLQGDARVLDAIVVARPDEILGAVPVAQIIAHPGASTSGLLEALEQRCQVQLSRYKRPAAFELVEDFPRTSTGKVRRRPVVPVP